MAEIHIEKKSGNPWPWIIAIIVVIVLAVGAFFIFADETTRHEVFGDPDPIEQRETPPQQPQPGTP